MGARDRESIALSTSWRVDETYVKVRGRWTYLYRAVDKFGNTIDFYLSPTRISGLSALTEAVALLAWNLDGQAA